VDGLSCPFPFKLPSLLAHHVDTASSYGGISASLSISSKPTLASSDQTAYHHPETFQCHQRQGHEATDEILRINRIMLSKDQYAKFRQSIRGPNYQMTP
jgi:hypothetical protein